MKSALIKYAVGVFLIASVAHATDDLEQLLQQRKAQVAPSPTPAVRATVTPPPAPRSAATPRPTAPQARPTATPENAVSKRLRDAGRANAVAPDARRLENGQWIKGPFTLEIKGDQAEAVPVSGPVRGRSFIVSKPAKGWQSHPQRFDYVAILWPEGRGRWRVVHIP